MRQQLHLDMMTAKSLMKQEMKNFKTIFGRRLEVVEYYGDKNAEIVLVAMGSVIGTMKEAVDGLRNKGQSVGLIKVVSLRPFPAEEVVRSLKRAKTVAVLDKSISLGAEGILATEIRRVVKDKKIISFVAGLGGRDITISTIERIYHQAKTTDKAVELINK